MAQYTNLTLDTTAPSYTTPVSLASRYKANQAVSVTASGASYMKIWASTSSTVGTGAPTSWSAYSSSWTTNFSAEGTNYVHAIFMDEVGNKTTEWVSSAIVYDLTAPTINSVSVITENPTDETSATIRVNLKDNFANNVTVTIASSQGDIVQTVQKTQAVSANTNANVDVGITIKPSGTYPQTINLQVTATDAAGNTSTSTSFTTLTYDPRSASLTATICNTSGNALGAYTSSNPISIKLTSDDSSRITGYKIWGDITTSSTGTTATSKPSTFTTASWSSGQILISNLYLTKSEGNKTVYCEAQLTTGAAAEGTGDSIILDLTDPTISISANKTIISNVTNYNTVTFSGTVTDTYVNTTTQVGIYVGDTLIKSVNINSSKQYSVSCTYAEITAKSSGAGAKTFKVKVTDLSGRVGTSSTTTVTLDNAGPTSAIVVGQAYINAKAQAGLATTFSDPSGVSQIKLWVDTSSSTTTPPSGATAITYDSSASYTVNDYFWSGTANGTYYAHAWAVDSVGNTSVKHSAAIIYYSSNVSGQVIVAQVEEAVRDDNTAKSYVNTRTISVFVRASNTGNNGVEETHAIPLTQVKFTGDITSTVTANLNYSGGVEHPGNHAFDATVANIELKSGDGEKRVYVQVKDACGNWTALVDGDYPNASTSGSWNLDLYGGSESYTQGDVSITSTPYVLYLDTTGGSITTNVYNAGTTTTVNSIRNLNTFNLKLTPAGTQYAPIKELKLWGDLNTYNSEANARVITSGFGTDGSITITGLTTTTTQGQKKIYGYMTDLVDNVYYIGGDKATGHLLFTYDTTAPVITINSIAYNKFSKINENRQGTTPTGYTGPLKCNQTQFKWKSDSKLTEYKVCVNAVGQTIANATAIPKTGGSINTSGTTVNANTDVLTTIFEADFESVAPKTSSSVIDGVYEIIVYGKDEGGNWSALHTVTKNVN